MPTTAVYKEPGDVAPRFTLDMFKNNYNGALAVMTYYFDALNWDAATGATPSIYGLVCPSACDQEIRISKDRATRREHLKGGRVILGGTTIARPDKTHKADWGGQFVVLVAAGQLLRENGRIVSTFPKNELHLELDTKFVSGRWKIVGIYFVQ